MTELSKIVTWEAAENLGKIPGSDWVCPLSSVAKLSFYEKRHGEVTDEVIQRLADGRPQYLELLRYPEGYHSLQVIDAATGEVRTDEGCTRRYEDYFSFRINNRRGHPTPGIVPVVNPGRTLFIDQNRAITSFDICDGMSCTVVNSSPIKQSHYVAVAQLFGSLTLEPQEKACTIGLRCSADAFGGSVQAEIYESDALGAGATITVLAGDRNRHHEQVNLRLDAAGQIKGVDSSQHKGFLRELGVDTDQMYWKATGNGIIVDSDQQKIAADSLADILGLGPRWTGLDLRLTAAGLYAALSCHEPNFSEIAVLSGASQSTTL